jgi:serine/threonine protein kinase
LHDHRIVHRDLKPDNVLVECLADRRSSGGGGAEGSGGGGGAEDNISGASAESVPSETLALIKIADFGESLDCIAEQMDGFAMRYESCHLPKGGAPAYLPPEVSNGTPGRGVVLDYSKSDMFSCGMIAHNMLSGGVSEPFSTADARQYSEETYNPLPDRTAGRELRELVWRMLQPDPAARSTLAEAEAALERMITASITEALNVVEAAMAAATQSSRTWRWTAA